MTKFICHLVVVCALFLLQADVSFAQHSSPQQLTVPPLKVDSGDQLEVVVYDNPDLSGHFRVDEKGDIVVTLLGGVHVEGKTAAEIGKMIEKRYSDEEILPLHRDSVTVSISEYVSQGITVSGEVRSPGKFPALGLRMLHDVINAAGGVQITASSQVLIIRKTDQEHPITVEYNPTALTPVIPQVQVFPGDTIVVPRAGVVYLLGNVGRPGAYILEGRNGLTVEAAIALAGSVLRASKNRVHLVRTLAGGRKEDIIISIDLIQKGKAPDIAMKDGDILFVPPSRGKLAVEQAINSAVGIGTSVITYRSLY